MQNKEERKLEGVRASVIHPEVSLKGRGKINAPEPMARSGKITKSVAKKIEAEPQKTMPKPSLVAEKSENVPNTQAPKPILEPKIENIKVERKTIEKSIENPKEKKQINILSEISKLLDKIKKIDKKTKSQIKGSESKTDASDKLSEFIHKPRVLQILMFAVIALVISVIVVMFFVIKPFFNNDGIPNSITVMYVFDETIKKDYAGDYVFQNGKNQVYVNLSAVSEHISLMAIGDTEKMRFYKTDGTYLSVEKDSRYVIINGVEIVLPAPVIFEGKEVFVPSDLLIYYSSGLSVEYNMYRERLTVTYANAEKDLKFLPVLPQPIDPIPEPEN